MAALFFDLDGTLVDSERQHWKAWQTTLHALGIALPWSYYEEESIGLTDASILRKLLDRHSRLFCNVDMTRILAEKKQRFRDLVRASCPMSRDTASLLHALSGVSIALVTSSTRYEASAILESAGVIHCFKTIICFDDVRQPKPAPEPYLQAMKQLRTDRGIAFEDSAAGQTSAATAGLKVIAVPAPSGLRALVNSVLPSLGFLGPTLHRPKDFDHAELNRKLSNENNPHA